MKSRWALPLLVAWAARADAPVSPEPPSPGTPPVYEERVEVVAPREGKAPTSVREGVILVRVVGTDGAFASGLRMEDFTLNRGRVDVVAITERDLPPAMLMLIDRMSWASSASCRSQLATADGCRELARTIAQEFPRGQTAFAFLGAHGAEDVVSATRPLDRGWIRHDELAARLSGPLRPFFDRPPVRLEGDAPKHLLLSLADQANRFDAAAVAGSELFLVVVSDGSEGDARANYRVIQTLGDQESLWPLPARKEAQSGLARMLAARRVHPMFVRVPRPGLRGSEGFSPLSVWADAPTIDMSRTAALCDALEGCSIDARGSTARDIARQVADFVHERTRFYGIAWRMPPSEVGGRTFLSIAIKGRDDLHCVPERIGAQLLLNADPYVAPWIGSLDDMPAKLGLRLGAVDMVDTVDTMTVP